MVAYRRSMLKETLVSALGWLNTHCCLPQMLIETSQSSRAEVRLSTRGSRASLLKRWSATAGVHATSLRAHEPDLWLQQSERAPRCR